MSKALRDSEDAVAADIRGYDMFGDEFGGVIDTGEKGGCIDYLSR